MNVGYSIWSDKLNIYGKVTLDFEPPSLSTQVISTGEGRYTTDSGLDIGNIHFIDIVSEEYLDNSLVTTLKVHKNLGMSWFSTDINISFLLKNTSKEGYLYTDGKVTQLEVSNYGGAVNRVSTSILPSTISSGSSADFNFSARINRINMRQDVYYKYAITFDVDGVTRYFFYTIKILA